MDDSNFNFMRGKDSCDEYNKRTDKRHHLCEHL